MTDQRLRDLLHESVAEAVMTDAADAAWRSGTRSRRRRTAGLVGAATALVVGTAGGIALAGHDRSPSQPTTGPSTTGPSTSTTGVAPYRPGDGAPDAHYRGLPVWWSPTLTQESRLPVYPDSPLPPVIDLRQPASSLARDPIGRAVAAFAVSRGRTLMSVDVLGADGLLRAVDLQPSPVQPMTDPEGNRRVRVGPSLLSRSGKYLLFPQDHSLLVYTLRTGRWHTIHTGGADTWDATWIGNTRIALADPARPLAVVPEYSVDGTSDGSGNVTGSGLPGFRLQSSQPYGRARTGRHGVAQAFYQGDPIPQPPALGLSPGQSDWINVNGPPGAILLIPAEPGRQKGCCQVDGWLGPDTVMYDSSSATGTRLLAWDVGTGRFFQVSRLTGVTLGVDTVAASYAQVPAAGAPLPY